MAAKGLNTVLLTILITITSSDKFGFKTCTGQGSDETSGAPVQIIYQWGNLIYKCFVTPSSSNTMFECDTVDLTPFQICPTNTYALQINNGKITLPVSSPTQVDDVCIQSIKVNDQEISIYSSIIRIGDGDAELPQNRFRYYNLNDYGPNMTLPSSIQGAFVYSSKFSCQRPSYFNINFIHPFFKCTLI